METLRKVLDSIRRTAICMLADFLRHYRGTGAERNYTSQHVDCARWRPQLLHEAHTGDVASKEGCWLPSAHANCNCFYTGTGEQVPGRAACQQGTGGQPVFV